MQITRAANIIKEVQYAMGIIRRISNKGGLSVLEAEGLQALGMEGTPGIEYK